MFENYDYAVEAIQENFSESLNKILKEQSNKDIRDIIAGSDDMNLAENYEQYSSRINRFLDDLLGENYNKVLMIFRT